MASVSTAKMDWLFALSAERGTITESQGEYYLEISAGDVAKAVAFTDRPYRQVKVITIDELAAEWTNPGASSFEADPPNASLCSEGTPIDIIEIQGTTFCNGRVTFRYKYLSSTQHGEGEIKAVVLTVEGLERPGF